MLRSRRAALWMAPEVRNRLLLTLAVLVVCRLAIRMPVPGLNMETASITAGAETSEGISGAVLLLDVLTGGAVSTFSVLAVGLYAYVAAQFLIYLVIAFIPALSARIETDPARTRGIVQRWTSVLATLVGLAMSFGLLGLWSTRLANCLGGYRVAGPVGPPAPGWLSTLAAVFALIAGAKIVEWLAQVVSRYGIPNLGTPAIVCAGILAGLPTAIGHLASEPAGRWIRVGAFVLVTVLSVILVIYLQGGQREVRIIIPRRQSARSDRKAPRQFVPMPVNAGGVAPVIAAQSLLALPLFLALPIACAGGGWTQAALALVNFAAPNNLWLWLIHFALVVALTFIYAEVHFYEYNLSEKMRRSGTYVPGVKPGEATQRYLSGVQRRITLPGALLLAFVAVLPYLVNRLVGAGVLLLPTLGRLVLVGTIRDSKYVLEAEAMGQGYGYTSLVG